MSYEKLSVKGLGCASGILWGVAVLGVGLANLMIPMYGRPFLRLVASIYPLYVGAPTLQQVLVATAVAIVDGFIGGVIFAWIYNLCARPKK